MGILVVYIERQSDDTYQHIWTARLHRYIKSAAMALWQVTSE